MRVMLVLFTFLTLSLCGQNVSYGQRDLYKTKFDDAIPVLNVATLHMGETSDASSMDFDAFNMENQLEVRKVAALLAEFKPTIIVIEDLPKNDSIRTVDYLSYVQDPTIKHKKPSEIELLAYEVGRLSGATKIYGIDFKEEYNYFIAKDVENSLDKTTVKKYWKLIEENVRTNPTEGIPFYDLFRLINHPQYLESLIVLNADILTYTSSKGKSEGADEASKFYHRNLVMFSNLNQIPLNENDRVFILMAGTHTAFFNDFLKRSPNYKLVNTFEYLK